MTGFWLVFVFVFTSCSTSVRTAPALIKVLHSPCPHIFAYEKIPSGSKDSRKWVSPSENQRWRGVVTVSPTIPIFLKIKFLVPTILPSKYVGRIELAEGKDQVVSQIASGLLKKMKYYVYFPAQIPIPELIQIEINSRVICSQPSAPRRLKTTLKLEHSLITMTNMSSRDGIGDVVSPKEVPLPPSESNSRSGCGKENLKNLVPSVPGNRSVSIGDWPWMVPLFKKTDLGLQFFCSSTLITRELVVTAAHCIKFKNLPPVRLESVVAYVGRYDITNWTDENSQPRQLSEIFIHPDFDPEYMHSDLAVLKFSKPVVETPHVAPACLWVGDHSLSAVVGQKGIVFGWGTDGKGNKVTPTPKLAVMPIVSQEECIRSKMEFLFLTTNRTLCAGFRNGTGPCNGDSGGGLLVPRRDDTGEIRWFLRGVVSLSLMQDSQVMCDVHEYTVFTDVAKYQDWILILANIQPRNA